MRLHLFYYSRRKPNLKQQKTLKEKKPNSLSNITKYFHLSGTLIAQGPKTKFKSNNNKKKTKSKVNYQILPNKPLR